MQVARAGDEVGLRLNELEGRLLRLALQQLVTNYRVPPGQVDPQTAQVWYSTRGCVGARMSDEEIREWLEHLHGFRTARLVLLEDCLRQCAPRPGRPCGLRLKLGEAPELMTALNDHRLLLAAQNDIGQQEMDVRTVKAFEHLSPAQRQALLQISFLAELIQNLLESFAPDAANWMIE